MKSEPLRHANRLRIAPSVFSLVLVLAVLPVGAQSPAANQRYKDASKTATDIRKATGSKAAPQEQLPSGDPCTILAVGDVQKIFPGVKPERSKRLEEYGTTECAWKGPSGTALIVQESYNEDTNAKQTALGKAQGFIDPMSASAAKNVRVEAFPALGDAAAIVEKADRKKGILSDAALMELRKGRHNISMVSGDLPDKDRAAALKSFEALGRVAAQRL
jgi:hypothetical protein